MSLSPLIVFSGSAHAWDPVYSRVAEGCYQIIESLVAREALNYYSLKKAKQHVGVQAVSVFVPSTLRHTWEKLALDPQKLNENIDPQVDAKVAEFPRPKSDFFYSVLSRTAELFNASTRAHVAVLICKSEFKKPVVDITYSKLVRTQVYKSTERFFSARL